MHQHQRIYYFSCSTGNTHLLCYASGDNPCGPQRIILTQMADWTSHHSICEQRGKALISENQVPDINLISTTSFSNIGMFSLAMPSCGTFRICINGWSKVRLLSSLICVSFNCWGEPNSR